MKRRQRVPVTLAALRQRVSRRLAATGERLKTCRPDQTAFPTLGRFYTVNNRHHVSATKLDLEATARALGALGEWERIDG